MKPWVDPVEPWMERVDHLERENKTLRWMLLRLAQEMDGFMENTNELAFMFDCPPPFERKASEIVLEALAA